MKKKILVIGAGKEQVDAIQRAKEIGYTVLASDGDPQAPGFAIADAAKVIDIEDIGQNLKWAQEEKIEGVLFYGALPKAIPTVLAIREHMQLPGLARHASSFSLNKLVQRKKFTEHKIRQPIYAVVKDEDSLIEEANSMGFPCLIKPIDNSLAKGLSMVLANDELVEAFRYAQINSKCEEFLVEECIAGQELTVEGFSMNGEHHILAISQKHRVEFTECASMQLTFPADISHEQEQEVIRLVRSALDVLKVDHSPTHSKVVLNPGGIKILEVNCYGGGLFIFSHIIKAVSGYDIVANWTRFCAGDAIEPIHIKRNGAVLKFYKSAPGRLVKVQGLEDAMKIEGIKTGLFYQEGEIVPPLKFDGDQAGWIIAAAPNREQALERVDRAYKTVQLTTVPV